MLRYRSSEIEAAFNTLEKSIKLTGQKAQAGAIASLYDCGCKNGTSREKDKRRGGKDIW